MQAYLFTPFLVLSRVLTESACVLVWATFLVRAAIDVVRLGTFSDVSAEAEWWVRGTGDLLGQARADARAAAAAGVLQMVQPGMVLSAFLRNVLCLAVAAAV